MTALCVVGGFISYGCGGGGGGGGGFVSTNVVGGGGGSVTAQGATVTVPAGALSQPVTVTVTPGAKVASGAFIEAGGALQLGPSGTTFASLATVTIPYDPAKLQAAGKTTADLVVLHRNDTTGTITTIKPSSVDTAKNTVTFTLSSFSTVQPALPANVDPDKSQIVVLPSSVLADGQQKATIQVVAKNTAGEVYQGVTVVFSATGSNNTLVQPSGTTDAQGQASGTLASTVVETKTITATVGGVTLTTKPTVSFTLFPTLRITGPLPFERVPTGTTLRITWTSTNLTNETVTLSASTDGGANWTTVGSGLAPVSSTTWTPPAAAKARLRLVSSSGIVQDLQNGDFTFTRVWFVDNTATGTADGQSWATAVTSIQTGIDLATAGDQVWVANKNVYTGGSSPLVRLKSGVDLVGGFSGTETSLSQRGSSFTHSTIDGQTNRQCMIADTGVNTNLDGIRFFRGSGFPCGGLLAGSARLVVANCVFESCSTNDQAGGAMFVTCPSVTLRDCTFKSNTSTGGNGGGAALAVVPNPYSLSSFTARNVAFTQNTANGNEARGGAVYLAQAETGPPFNTNATLLFDSCTFSQNTAGLDGGALFAIGCVPTITKCTFTSNTATRNGGAVALLFSRPDITLSTFSSNTANGTSGGVPAAGLSVFGAGALSLEQVNGGAVKQCSFLSNTASAGAGVLLKGPFNKGDQPLFENCLFAKNTASRHGGGVFAGASTFAKFTFCTITDNNATMNGNGFGIAAESSAVIANTIVFGNVGAVGSNLSIFENAGSVSGYVTVTTSDVGPAIGANLSTDPLFVNKAGGDYHLQAGSACINTATAAGAPAKDRDDLARDAQPDIGAFEKR